MFDDGSGGRRGRGAGSLFRRGIRKPHWQQRTGDGSDGRRGRNAGNLLRRGILRRAYWPQRTNGGVIRGHNRRVILRDSLPYTRDGIEPIVSDVHDAAKIPSQRIFIIDPSIQEDMNQFLEKYFLIFDGNDRAYLLDAYEKYAYFSVTLSSSRNNKLNKYLRESRNLFRINDTTRRRKLLKQGRLPVVSFLSELPRTRHLLDTFTMDISLATQTMIFITITGYFQELDNKNEPIHYFNRTFIIVSEGEGYRIRNEQLHIDQTPETQSKQLHQRLSQLINQQAQLATQALRSIEEAKPMATELNDDIRQQMTMTLSQQTNMNLEWSFKCLQELQWNYCNAFSAFQKYFAHGQVPSEAFIK